MSPSYTELAQFAQQLPDWAQQLGLQQLGISGIELDHAETQLNAWLARHYHGEMDYMARHGTKRSRPAELVPDTLRVISVRMDYLPAPLAQLKTRLENPHHANISCYAQGRDYHKVLRQRLKQLALRITEAVGEHQWRVFTDSAPVLEKPLAVQAGLGWIGKHTNLIHPRAGSLFFLGELYTDLPLPIAEHEHANHCGRCQACIDICPTQAIIAPYQLDARRCISYLTIELHGDIPEELRPLIGNRIYGCDDCQLVCPWNRFAQLTTCADFLPRQNLDNSSLIALFQWTEAEFLSKTEGSPIRRIGYERWLRNLAVALGNAPSLPEIRAVLQARLNDDSEMVQRHVAWAWQRHDL